MRGLPYFLFVWQQFFDVYKSWPWPEPVALTNYQQVKPKAFSFFLHHLDHVLIKTNRLRARHQIGTCPMDCQHGSLGTQKKMYKRDIRLARFEKKVGIKSPFDVYSVVRSCQF